MAMFLAHLLHGLPGRYHRDEAPDDPVAAEFASELLIPRDLLSVARDEQPDPAKLARQFRVSPSAIKAALDRLDNATDPRDALGIPASAPPEIARSIFLSELHQLVPSGSETIPLQDLGRTDEALADILELWNEARPFEASPCALHFDRLTQTPSPERIAEIFITSRQLIVDGGWCRRYSSVLRRGRNRRPRLL